MTAPLTIFAAGSLRPAFDPLAAGSSDALVLSYDNARDLAQRIVAAEPADVFASASVEHPRMLYADGLVDAPRAFATNRLVVAVAQASEARDAGVLAARGTRVVIEVAGVPLGDYTRVLLERMDWTAGEGFAERALANVVAQEELVDDVADRLLNGDADAGVLYATDVAARPGLLRAIELPPEVDVAVTYVACTVTASAEWGRARAWVGALFEPAAQSILRAAGFVPAEQ